MEKNIYFVTQNKLQEVIAFSGVKEVTIVMLPGEKVAGANIGRIFSLIHKTIEAAKGGEHNFFLVADYENYQHEEALNREFEATKRAHGFH